MRPWPAIGWMTCAASPRSARRGAAKRRAMPKASGCACGGVSSAIAPEPQPEAALDLVPLVLGIEPEEVRHAPGVLGPDDRGAVAERPAGRERQDRERPRRQEVLDGAALVVALMGDRRDDRRLRVRPADPADAGLLAQPRARAVGSDQEMGVRAAAAGERAATPPRPRPRSPRPRRGAGRRPPHGRPSISAAASAPLSTIWAKGSPGSTSPSKVRNTGRTGSRDPAVGDHHVEDRLRPALDRPPDAERREHPPRAGGDRIGAPVAGGIAGERRIVDRHLERRAERLLQRQRQRQPRDAAAGDGDAPGGSVGGSFVRLVRHAPLCPRRAALSSGVTPLAYL